MYNIKDFGTNFGFRLRLPTGQLRPPRKLDITSPLVNSFQVQLAVRFRFSLMLMRIGRILSIVVMSALLLAQQPEAVPRGATTSDWPVYGGTSLAWRYSALDQINSGNIKKLVPVWSFETGDYQDGLTSTPIVLDGIVYVSSASSNVFALNGATGDLIWQYK